MWTEVYIDKRWIPIDGTLALGGIGAGHLEIAHTNLQGASAYSAFLPVVQVARAAEDRDRRRAVKPRQLEAGLTCKTGLAYNAAVAMSPQ